MCVCVCVCVCVSVCLWEGGDVFFNPLDNEDPFLSIHLLLSFVVPAHD